MTFKGDTIVGKPTLAMVEIYVAERGMLCEAVDAYNYWNKKGWLTKKGTEVVSLEIAIDVYNGIVLQKAMKKAAKKTGIGKITKKNKKKAKRELKKQLLAGNKGLDNLIKLEKFEPKKKEQQVEKKDWTPYEEQLQDKRWEAFRKFIFAVRGKKCEMCGGTHILQVHHPKYKGGRLAWEYTCNEVQVLCKECHEKVHNIK